MDYAAYEQEAKAEKIHWWFAARRTLFMKELTKWGVPKDAKVIDIGTSTGTNLRMLKDNGFTNFIGVDLNKDAIAFCHDKGFEQVFEANACSVPFEDDTFDVVLATDIIEHIDDDIAALNEIQRILKPGGVAVVTVPAHKILWGANDDFSHHKRRYTRTTLNRQIAQSGLNIEKEYYFNFILYMPILLARVLGRLLNWGADMERSTKNSMINNILFHIFSADIAVAPHVHMPFGVSIFTLLRKGQ